MAESIDCMYEAACSVMTHKVGGLIPGLAAIRSAQLLGP